MDLDITFKTLVYIAGGLTTLIVIYYKLKDLLKPFEDVRKKINEHENKLNNDFSKIQRIEDDMEMILKTQLMQLEHMRTNNSTGKIKKIETEVTNYLIERKNK
ncbi:hypothetical protein [Anaerofustis stercorihominis]|uniref:hypothetical protein n=1 Tax=Anaerofustis stercorihominis TaxID=214853 RepID=UPI00214C1764|nr:hypothetical protein [Anaerofustis stercorihominis]MCR2033722.1 hypothetical protein [Anaerofustis stercorihominis]